jgi:hypothetical protein
MYGTLKGFAKFLFESPTKYKHHDTSGNSISNTSRLSERISTKHILNLENERATKLAIAEKSFAVYCSDSRNLYYIGDSFEPEHVARREIKNFQLLNGNKYLVA